MKNLKLILISIFTAGILYAQNIPLEGAFHFNAYKLTSESQISAASLNHPITEKDRISVSADGHLQADGKRIQIWGTNLSEFPQTKQQADFFAKALADQGYNCIRFHHTDASWTKCFVKKTESGKWIIDEKGLDNFDYFFKQLKENGIYSNINFLTGRTMTSKDGYRKEVDSYSDWKTTHDLAIWNQEALEKQQEYAFDLMTHVNPYTGIAYKDDPAVAIVEINNENGLLMGYTNGWLEDVTGSYWTELEEQWNDWLLKQNLNYKTISSKYNRSEPITANLILPEAAGRLEQHSGAKATVKHDKNVITLKVEKNGTDNWHIQYNYPGLSMSNDKVYTIKFSAKASKESQINISLMQAHDPWQNAGFSNNLKLSSQWTDFEYVIEGISTDKNLRLNFGSMGKSEGTTFYFKDLYILEGGNIENIKPSNRNKNSVALPHYADYQLLPENYKNLVMKFFWEKEDAYWLTMIDFVRNTINSKALIMGTAAGCSTTVLQSNFDIIDSHAYWNHPIFTGRSWDMSNFYVGNKDLAKAGSDSTLTGLAKYRVYGKPFSVSEYDHPYPNQYLSQDYPMVSSFGSFQDWDCIFTFCHEIPKTKDGQKGKINGYFDQSNNPAKACASPIASRIFRQRLVQPAKTKIAVPLTKEIEQSLLSKMHAWALGNPELFGSIPNVSLKYQLGIKLEGVTPESSEYKDISSINKLDFPERFIGFDETKQIYWNQQNGTFMVCNPNVSVSVMNKYSTYPGIPEEWNPCVLLPAKCLEDYSCVAAVKDIVYPKDKKPYLIFSCSWVGNSNENLSEYGKKYKSPQIIRDPVKLTTTPSLGSAPVLALSCDANLFVTTKKAGTLYTTGLEGNKNTKIKATSNEYWTYKITKKDNTLWYILE